MTTETFYFGPPSHRLFGAFHSPRMSPRMGLLFTPPFGEEMTETYAQLSMWAKQLAAAGLAVMRFHPFGTGDSDGDSVDFTLETAVSDTLAALEHLRSRLEGRRVGVFGLRFGAAVALRAAQLAPVDFLLLWSPIVDLPRYVGDLLRLRLTREVVHQRPNPVRMTRQDMVKELEAGRPIDLFGMMLSPDFYQQMRAQMAWSERVPAARVLWLARNAERGDAERRIGAWRARNGNVELGVFPEVVFWEKTNVLPRYFAQASEEWLAREFFAV